MDYNDRIILKREPLIDTVLKKIEKYNTLI